MSKLEDRHAEDLVLDQIRRVDPDGSRMARVLRDTLDQLYDGQHTGRYRWDQLFKTEKTHCGTLVEINIQREFHFQDGVKLDFTIAGQEVDCKYSQTLGGWMIPKEAHGEICLVVTADDARGLWSAGVIRARPEWLNLGENRDAKVTIKAAFRDEHVRWLQRDAVLPPNVLLALPKSDVDAIFAKRSGQQRVDELFRRASGLRIGRGVVATVAQQADFMKRVRGNGGARTRLQPEGILLLGDSQAHRRIAAALGVPEASKGETVSVRVVQLGEGESAQSVELDGVQWRVASPGEPAVAGPNVPNPRVSPTPASIEQTFGHGLGGAQ